MALQSTYKQFLSSPNVLLLAEDASYHYITTLVTYNGASNVVKHLKSQSDQLKKKEEVLLDAIEGPDALAVVVETTVEFLIGGGAYLPGLDDNFLADRTVTFPIIHMVNFDSNGRIAQIRQSWDQGSLLKLIDVIGKTGRNWPIRDGKEQIKLIASSVKSGGKFKSEAGGERPSEPIEVITRSRENSTNVTRDPHASLSLFAPRDHNRVENSHPAVVAPRASAKPPPREYSELFVGSESDNLSGPVASTENKIARGQSESPSKFPAGVALKAGAGKNYQPIRLFETDENSPASPSPEKNQAYRLHPKKYQHFEFADGSDLQDTPKPNPITAANSKHGSQWTFDDFVTPDKVVPLKVLKSQSIRHWGTENDEVPDSPIRAKRVDKPRKDAETHFEFVDDGMSEGTRRLIGRPRGIGSNGALGLYQNNLYGDDGQKEEPRVLGPIANIKDRHKDFDPHFNLTDESPSAKDIKQSERLAEDKLKAVKMMDANWDIYDQSPIASNQKENATPISMSPTRLGLGKGPLSESTNMKSNRNENYQGIAIGGDGMGGKKGAGRNWGFGDDSGGEEAGGLNSPSSKFRRGISAKGRGTNSQSKGGEFWDF